MLVSNESFSAVQAVTGSRRLGKTLLPVRNSVFIHRARYCHGREKQRLKPESSGAGRICFFLWFPSPQLRPAAARPTRGWAQGPAPPNSPPCGGGGRPPPCSIRVGAAEGERRARKAGRELPISGKPSAAETPTKWRRRTEEARGGGGGRWRRDRGAACRHRGGPRRSSPHGRGRAPYARARGAAAAASSPQVGPLCRGGGGGAVAAGLGSGGGLGAGGRGAAAARGRITSSLWHGRPGSPGPFSPRRERAGRGRGRRCRLRFPRRWLASLRAASRSPGNGSSGGAAGPAPPCSPGVAGWALAPPPGEGPATPAAVFGPAPPAGRRGGTGGRCARPTSGHGLGLAGRQERRCPGVVR